MTNQKIRAGREYADAMEVLLKEWVFASLGLEHKDLYNRTCDLLRNRKTRVDSSVIEPAPKLEPTRIWNWSGTKHEPAPKPETCTWTGPEKDVNGVWGWKTNCGVWTVDDNIRAPSLRRIVFCPYCGKRIVVVQKTVEAERDIVDRLRDSQPKGTHGGLLLNDAADEIENLRASLCANIDAKK